MNHEDRLRSLLREAAVDPGPAPDWERFRRTAHRDQLFRRALFAGGITVVALLVVLMSAVLREGVFDETLPRPANPDRQEERAEDGDERVDDVELELERGAKELERQLEVAPPGLTGEGAPGEDREVTAPAEEGGDRPRAAGETPEDDEDDRSERTDSGPVRCRGDRATILGTDGPDVLAGTAGRDVIAGLAGDDVIRGLGAGDYICAGDGDDELHGDDGHDSLLGGPGDDRIDGGAGTFDLVEHPGVAGPVEADLVKGIVDGEGTDLVSEIEVVIGTPGPDTLAGDDEKNWLIGEGGNDALDGRGADDVLEGGPGDDYLNGSSGSDLIAYWGVSASAGRPGVNVDLSADRAIGAGVDRLESIEKVMGSMGDDVISGNVGANLLNGNMGNDTVSGAGGDDFVLGYAGDDRLDGGPGDDFVDGGTEIDTCTNTERRQNCEAGTPVAGPPGAPRSAQDAFADAAFRRRRGH